MSKDLIDRLYEAAQDNPDSMEWKAADMIETLTELVGSSADTIERLERERDDLLAELLRVKEICLREVGIGIVNEVVISRVKEGK